MAGDANITEWIDLTLCEAVRLSQLHKIVQHGAILSQPRDMKKKKKKIMRPTCIISASGNLHIASDL